MEGAVVDFIVRFVGALIATRMLSAVLFWVTRRWRPPSTARTIVVHLFSLAIAVLAYNLNTGQPVSVAVSFYGLPQLVWFVADMLKPRVFAGRKLER